MKLFAGTVLPILLQFLAFEAASAFSQLKRNDLSTPINGEHKLEPFKPGDGKVKARQVLQCATPGWVPCGPNGCRPPDAACCGVLYYYYPETETCCSGGSGSCPLTSTCCGAEFCCKSGATCGADGLCSATSEPTQTQPTRSASTQSPTRTVSVSMSTRTATATTMSAEEEETCSIPANKRATVTTFTVPFQERYTTIPNSGGKKACLDNRELMNSMCKGIKKARGCVAEEMKLTYKPELASSNRQKMCPDSFCLPENVECDPANPSIPCNPYANFMTNPINSYKYDQFHLSCDEFPFAASAQGGTGTAICIPGWQNSFQGGKLNQLKAKVGAGNDYVVKVTGWSCKNGEPVSVTNCGGRTKRDEVGSGSLTQDDFFTNFTDSGENALMMYLGDVSAGIYRYELNIGSGTFTDLLAIDSQGNTLSTVAGGLRADSKTQTVSFQVIESTNGVSLWAFTKDANVSVSYNVTSAPLPVTTSTSMQHSVTAAMLIGIATVVLSFASFW